MGAWAAAASPGEEIRVMAARYSRGTAQERHESIGVLSSTVDNDVADRVRVR